MTATPLMQPARHIATLLILCFLSACTANPTQPAGAAPAQAELRFVDLQGFDRDLSASLSAPLPQVQVAFYDHVAPSALPERLQQWMAAVEAGGGKVQVQQPKPTVTAKSPFMLISAVSSLWTASKMAKDLATKAQFKAAHDYDADIIIKVGEKGEAVVDKVVFVQRKK